MASTTTIPTKTYVTIQYRADSSAEGKLGFLSPYTKDAAFAKRKDTQDRWAYGYGINVAISDEDDVTVTGQGGGNNRAGSWDAAALFMSNCYPRILDNVLTEGFEIAKSVRRHGWNGSGNVLWRIADPRGFELEISSENFARVIDCAIIDKGVIQGKCVWGRDGSKNILLPESSDVYQDAVRRTEHVNTKISLNDVQVGDMVGILTKDGSDLSGQYLGKYFFLQLTQDKSDPTNRGYNYGNGTYRFNNKQVERYLFKNDTGYFVLSTPKLISIIEKISTPLDKMVVAQEVTDYITPTADIKDIDDVILVSPTKIKFKEVTSALVPFEWNDTLWPVANRYYTEAIVCAVEDKYGVAFNQDDEGSSLHPKPKGAKIHECSLNLPENTIRLKSTISTGGNTYWNRYTRVVNTMIPEFDMESTPKYKISVTANGITGKITTLGYYS